ncbi:uncharacterized protein N7479_011036 [Penicillium vulpinum]|uniref:Tetratricopeptide repeat protein n=1 Tax=Penicillium vulpinum TaxID=29845 RepID=A0A1V6RT72_9EURO|nr:uncharacterized protein N7479_011036 [Penicillium vulpinum]KAJ5952623.1 hypothetical protein N7479_011036 [Penicillium vulpinum]OQE04826.1 hypothetical protein PENVUL_c029G06854 [Penicillium vulpinum]
MANIFRRLRKAIKSRRSASKNKDTVINNLNRELAGLEQELAQAIHALNNIQTQLEHDPMPAHTTSGNLNLAIPPFRPDSEYQSDIPRTISPTERVPTCIDDIWLCSDSDSFLIDAEERWRHNDPELAMELASRVISHDPFLCELDEMRCRLFIAAVQHYLRQYEESMATLEMVVQINTCYTVFNNPESSIITGITHFIKGMNLMKLERFLEAYWSLSRALYIPGYSEKARECQREAIIGFTRIEAAEFDYAPAASTHALLDWEDSDSS